MSRTVNNVLLVFGLAAGVGLLLVGREPYLGVGLGLSLGSALGLFSWVMARRAAGADIRRQMRIVFGGMLLRLVVAGAAVALVVGLLSESRITFIASLLVSFCLFTVTEIAALNTMVRPGGAPSRE